MGKNLLKTAFTETDNETYCLSKLLAALTVLAGLFFQGVVIYKGQIFSMQEYGAGIALLFGGLSAIFWAKKDSVKYSETKV